MSDMTRLGMSIGLYLVGVIIFLWIIFRGGANRLDGTLKSGLLFSPLAVNWGAEGLKLAAWIGLIASTYYFVSDFF